MLPQTEVGDEGPPLGREQDVLGLQVAVDYAPLVRPRERRREAPPERERLLDRPGSLPEPLPERSSRDDRHDEERAVRRLSGVEERHEPVARRERSEEAPLPLEASEPLLVEPVEDLDRHLLPGRSARAEDGPCSAVAEGPQDLVGA